MEEWDLGSYRTFKDSLKRYSQMLRQAFHRDEQILHSEDCSGDFIYHCKNVQSSFGVIESQDCAYCYDAGHMKDCQDAYEPAFNCELQYDSHGCNGGKRMLSCHICYDNDSLAYCDFCHNSTHLFGCIGLRHKRYCILNKQYTKEEYEQLVPKIIEKMQADGEWGEFFPVEMSPFAYSETVAQEYFPLTREDVLSRGWHWRDEVDELPKVEKIIPAERLPDSIDDIPDDILNWAIKCELTARPFRIIKQELAFYRKMRLPVPRLHPDERHRRRMAFTNHRKLWSRKCAKCGKEIQTTYSPDRPEIVYCEECYLKEVY
jgi:CxxC-x17-CxxC domain-containing protein